MATQPTRRATHADVPALADLAGRTFPLACPPGTLQEDIDHFVATVLSESAFRTYLDDDERIVRVAPQGTALVGYTMLILSASTDPDVSSALTATDAVEVSKMYSDPAAHGTGVAAALMESAADEARRLGRSALWLGVNQQNARALAFYRRSGFRQLGEKRFPLGAVLHEDFVMQRDLT
ncbi:GNAT family N-acetyltransferase [Rhodococcus sp. BP-241]|uniref:GNAT family N-acetyltransferase n=1 Tax=Rhodococcus sp. BP-241 TaxID=2739441 RepID=UPI001C9AD5D7|nr:GNAT family N-acetyltransferase [Rhodococcus sp. BP-241]MBY6705479.1 GNAT family N-acetyltransferase [Rhodococcus sp. BP-241]